MIPTWLTTLFRWLFPVLFLFTLFYCSLVPLANRLLLPALEASLPFSEKSLQLTSLSPFHLQARLTIGNHNISGITLPVILLTYSPLSLYNREIKQIDIIGGVVHLDESPDGLQLRGLKQPKSNSTHPTAPDIPLPLAAQKLTVQNTTVVLHRTNAPVVELTISSTTTLTSKRIGTGSISLHSITGELHASGSINLDSLFSLELNDNRQRLSGTFKLPSIAQLTEIFPEIRAPASGELTVEYEIDLADFSTFDRYRFTAAIEHLQYNLNGIAFKNEASDEAIRLTVTGNRETGSYELHNLRTVAPLALTADFSGEFSAGREDVRGQGLLHIGNSAEPTQLSYQLELSADPGLKYSFACDPARLDDTIHISRFSGEGWLSYKNDQPSGDITITAKDLALPKFHITVPQLRGHFPFSLPLSTKKNTAWEISGERIFYRQKDLGAIHLRISPSAHGAAFSLSGRSPLLSGPPTLCTGEAQPGNTIDLACTMPSQTFDISSISDLVNLPPQLSFKAQIGAAAHFQLNSGQPTASLDVQISDGDLNFEKTHLSPISVNLHFPRLPDIATSPAQQCAIGSLRMNDLQLQDAQMIFRIEDSQTLFIEKSRASWAGGKIETGSLRIRNQTKELETTLYCDRLHFSKLLDQFGIRDTEGEGSLNGRLPVIIGRDGLRIEDGFLFSTPGNSGIVHFGNTDQLRRGLGAAGQSSYLEYTMQALENFAYNWTKISVNTENQELVIGLQLDGKPANPLPFGYRNGQIVPMATGGGLQHPIQLDVNFRLPMEDIFRYGQSIQSIMEKM